MLKSEIEVIIYHSAIYMCVCTVYGDASDCLPYPVLFLLYIDFISIAFQGYVSWATVKIAQWGKAKSKRIGSWTRNRKTEKTWPTQTTGTLNIILLLSLL